MILSSPYSKGSLNVILLDFLKLNVVNVMRLNVMCHAVLHVSATVDHAFVKVPHWQS